MRGLSLLARHALPDLAGAHAWLDIASAHAQPYLAGALSSPEDELAEVRISQVSLLPGQDSCTKSGHTTTTFKTTFFHVLVVLGCIAYEPCTAVVYTRGLTFYNLLEFQ